MKSLKTILRRVSYCAFLGIAAVVMGASLVGCGQVLSREAAYDGGYAEADGYAPSGSSAKGVNGLCYESADADAYYDGCYVPGWYDYNTEEYAAMKEHGFISVASQPFSTFSADVDTASYCNLRRMIQEGYAPESIPAGAVRIEEMLNYFDYSFAAPENGELFGVKATIADCPWNADTKLLVLGCKAKEDAAQVSKGNNLVFLIDVSGSMADWNKLDLLKDSFGYLVDSLDPNDTVSIVTYSGEERVVLDGMPAKGRGRIMRAIRSLDADGCTNGEAGLKRAYELAEKHFIEGGNNRIILASDGDLNVGMSSESELSDYVSEKRESGIYLSVLGFGEGNYKDTKMETIADDGNGAYYYIDCIEEAEKVFVEDLQSTMYTVADDVKLQVEFNPAYVKGYRQVGYENRALEADDFKDDTVDAGEVGSGKTVVVAYELVMADSKMQLSTSDSRYGNEAAGVENGEWLTMSVRYKNPGEDNAHEESHPVTKDDYTAKPGADWTFASQVIELGMLLNGSEYLGDFSKYDLLASLDRSQYKNERRVEFCRLAEEVLTLNSTWWDEEGHATGIIEDGTDVWYDDYDGGYCVDDAEIVEDAMYESGYSPVGEDGVSARRAGADWDDAEVTDGAAGGHDAMMVLNVKGKNA